MAFGTPSAAGTADHVTGTTSTPTLPSYSVGDILYYFAACRTGTVGITTPPSGYTLLASGNGMFLYGKKAAGGESAQQITFDEGTTGKSTVMWSCSGGDADNLGTITHTSATSSDASADAAIETDSLTITNNNCQILFLGIWANDLSSGGITVTDPTQSQGRLFVLDTLTGADHTICGAYANQTTAANVTTDSFAFSGGSELSRSLTVALNDAAATGSGRLMSRTLVGGLLLGGLA